MKQSLLLSWSNGLKQGRPKNAAVLFSTELGIMFYFASGFGLFHEWFAIEIECLKKLSPLSFTTEVIGFPLNVEDRNSPLKANAERVGQHCWHFASWPLSFAVPQYNHLFFSLSLCLESCLSVNRQHGFVLMCKSCCQTLFNLRTYP